MIIFITYFKVDNLNIQQFLDLKKVCNEEAAAKDKNSEEDNLPGKLAYNSL